MGQCSCAVCPLNFTRPLEVIKACRNVAAPSPSCCSSLNTYMAGIQNQMLITNKQAIICATVLGSKLRQGGVMTNVYELCDIDLKDFSIQGLFSQFIIIPVNFSLHFIIYSIWYVYICVCLCVDLCVGGCKAAYRQQGLPLSLSLSLLYADNIFGGYSKSSWKHMDVQCWKCEKVVGHAFYITWKSPTRTWQLASW
jgi:hypothetical protein